ncbi:MAG: NADH-quinone oxidoreductase subunit NuoK [Dehalococcoidales bacterium]|jgi:NADH:ubiquinone oxidoreductase subunit K|nr:NADH-quinone oxidoreductase subunit NuoK [Dehalococcoidales bacterium]MDD5605116.1 NADH-quinone oxidoreductase subunit NuoK [Dehalococcoidales bacterium]MDX9986699.1 NADH-quinone oxidoreductase subunit NuoK [Dehalococcoidales bacterium]NLE90406.1 NADH-quinone oxidoreductase subunit NuoK [Dehalococcoidales bacterium]
MPGLEHYLVLSALLFGIGLTGAIIKRNAIAVLMCIEIMLAGVNIAMVAFSRFITPVQLTGQLFTIFIIIVAAAEVAVGLSIILALYRHRQTVDTEKIDLLKW